jgi:hypothetical protein
MQTGSSGTLIDWKSGQTTFVPLWDRMEGAWLMAMDSGGQEIGKKLNFYIFTALKKSRTFFKVFFFQVCNKFRT